MTISGAGNGQAMLHVDGEFHGYYGGSFDAMRAVEGAGRHPLEWGDRSWARSGVRGVLHAASGQAP